MDKFNLKSAVESLLFVSGEPIRLAKIAKICNVSKEEAEKALSELRSDCQRDGRGIIIISKDGLVQLGTNPANSRFVEQLVSEEMSSELSGAASEVLSIIAYLGPISRLQIESIRGVNCSYTLRNLMIKGLIERKEGRGVRGYLYEISFAFLKSLGLSGVKQLPDWEKLSRDEKAKIVLSADGAEAGSSGEVPEAEKPESIPATEEKILSAGQ